MTTESFPAQNLPLGGVVEVPGSKSISNRALICAALADGGSCLLGVAGGDDTERMIAGLRLLGASLSETKEGGRDALIIAEPVSLDSGEPVMIDAGLAGTTSRFLTAVASLRQGRTTVTGREGLLARPMGELHRILRHLGAEVVSDRDGYLPVTVRRAPTSAKFQQGKRGEPSLRVSGDVSSQFISALMMIGPRHGGLHLRLDGPVVSRGYLHMTAQVMRAFGADVTIEGEVIRIGAAQYRAVRMHIDADWSSASYPFAAVAIAGGEVRVPHLRRNGAQPEEAFLEVLERMGCDVGVDDDGVRVRRDVAHPLRGVDVDMSEMSDLVPTLAVAAACAESPSRIRGVGFIRAKESDRLGDLAGELRACGAAVSVQDDGLLLEPRTLCSATLQTHDDHRLAMSLALLGLRVKGIRIEHPEVVSKSWPEYWAAMRSGFGMTG